MTLSKSSDLICQQKLRVASSGTLMTSAIIDSKVSHINIFTEAKFWKSQGTSYGNVAKVNASRVNKKLIRVLKDKTLLILEEF